ncbi:MAG: hypothetical protein R8K22_03415 [Mariprofundaceae bacterium]
MALTVHPTDGFINRLLQQSSRPASQQPTSDAKGHSNVSDQVNISANAKQAADSEPDTTKLENTLLQMYNQKGNQS